MPSTNSFVVCQPLQPHHPQECSVFVARDTATYPPIAQTNHFVSQPLKTQNHVQFLTEQAHAATPPVSETRPISVVSQDVGGHTLEKIALTLDKHFNPIPQTIHTPVNVDRLEVELRGHPDRVFVNNLIHNMTWGFNISYHGPRRSRVCRNLRSAREHPIAAGRCILKE